MPKRWRIRPHDPEKVAYLQKAANIPAVVAHLMLCRGISMPEDASRFLDPKLSGLYDPETLPGCADAATLLHEAIQAKRRIVVYGDYDVDGMTGTAVLLKCLRLLHADAGYYVPNRIDEGYGLNHEAIRTLASQGAQLIVTVDCGIASVEEALTAREVGVDLIISDHHVPGAQLPEAKAIVHPAIPGHDYPFHGLSGSGVALKIAWALCQQASGAKKVGQRMREFLLEAVGLASMGTIADMVPLVDENRILVRHGLSSSLAHYPSLGVATLMRLAKINPAAGLTSEDIGFALAPRLNAAGRLGQAQLAVELLTTDDADRAKELATYIDGLNQTRQTLERSIQRAAAKQARDEFDPENDAALVLADRGWHPGVIGIVAGRLAEKFHRPVILISWDQMDAKPGVGSARSVPGFNLHAALEACDEYLVSHGGHAAAAGLKIEESRLSDFRAAFCEVAAEEITDENRVAELHIDAELPLSAFTPEAVRQIETMGPFGQANPRPLISTAGAELAESPKTIGSGGRHLSMKLRQHSTTMRAVAFGGGDWLEALEALDGPIDIAFRPVINTFRGQRNVELHLVDWRPG